MVTLKGGLEYAKKIYYVANIIVICIHAGVTFYNEYNLKPKCSPHIRNFLMLDFFISLFSLINVPIEVGLENFKIRLIGQNIIQTYHEQVERKFQDISENGFECQMHEENPSPYKKRVTHKTVISSFDFERQETSEQGLLKFEDNDSVQDGH